MADLPTHMMAIDIVEPGGPVVHGDLLIVGGIGQPLLAVRPRGDTVETVWKNNDVPVHMSSPVLVGGLLFGLSRKRSGHLFCVDATTGETIWQGEARFAKTAALLAVGKQLVVLTSDGTLVVAAATRAGYRQLASYPVAPGLKSWATPAMTGNRILVKAGPKLTCWGVN